MAQTITRALVETYDSRYIEIYQRDAERATAFYQQQLVDNEITVDQTQEQVATYASSKSPTELSGDPEYRRLLDQAAAAGNEYNETQRILADISARLKAVTEEREDAFDVVDEASPAYTSTTGIKTLATFPIAGVLLATSIAAGLFAFLMKTDRSVRVAEDFAAIPGLAVLGTMPDVSHTKRRDWPKNFFRLAITTFGTPERPVRAEERQGGT
jgi:hypothetical protein